MIRVYSAYDLADAHLVHAELDDQGIKAVVQGEYLAGARGALPLGPCTAPTVWVNEGDVQAARRLIEEIEQRRRERPEEDPPDCADAD